MKPPAFIVIYRDSKGEWRWKVQAWNGRILADSGESYKRKAGLLKGLRAVTEALKSDTRIEWVPK